ncbi:MAG: tail fiber protein [Bacteroidota bacterium]|nr:tail fiber protein [Bacteroidota bacterium]
MENYIGEIRIFAGNFAPLGWLFCNGQLLSISDYEALFTLLGTTYGGDGQNTFALPNLQSRAVVGVGQGPGLSNYVLGQSAGTENVTLTTNQLPTHSHQVQAAPKAHTGTPTQDNPAGAYLGDGGGSIYAPSSGTGHLANGAFTGGQVSAAGASQAHSNIQPLLATNYIIATEGIYPSSN